MKKERKKQKGITLVALVITIIILLILAGISISTLTNQGILKKVVDAKKVTEEKTAEEDAILENYLEQMNVMTKGLSSRVKPGDYVSYTPDTASTDAILQSLSEYSGYADTSNRNTTDTLKQERNLKWRVLDIVDGKVRLISEVPTTSTIALKGWNGYNNAVYLIDEICETLYNKANYSNNVQNLKIEDIQNKMSIDYTKIDKFYGTKCSPATKNYPSIFAQEEGQKVNGEVGGLGLSKQDKLIKQTKINTAESWEVKYTYWYKDLTKTDFKTPIYYNLFMANEKDERYSTYWLSSRCVSADELNDSTCFYVRYIANWGGPNGQLLTHGKAEGDYVDGRTFNFRPVITLNSNVLLKSGEGTLSSPYEIEI